MSVTGTFIRLSSYSEDLADSKINVIGKFVILMNDRTDRYLFSKLDRMIDSCSLTKNALLQHVHRVTLESLCNVRRSCYELSTMGMKN